MQATAQAHPNIAFIKYWGNADDALKLPLNSSLSMNLDEILTETTVRWDDRLPSDIVEINGEQVNGAQRQRVSEHLDKIRHLANTSIHAHVTSVNNFPMGAGIASSASAFAALTVAAAAAAGLNLPERQLSTVARLGSGSAARSIPGGYVEWHKGMVHEDSFAESIAGPDHWTLVDIIVVLSREHKAVGSREGHTTAQTSDLQAARVAGAEQRLSTCKQAILDRDFATFAEVVELDSNLMHAVMMTSHPPLFYWLPSTLRVMEHVRQLRAEGVNICYTLDAGPNVHCITLQPDAENVMHVLQSLDGVQEVLAATPGPGAGLVDRR